ncbi:bifunctional DNA primase/polymerase [Mycobacterium colombiense CECT 3035]|uniref:Bifunctional DNA primase/polymerase n=1 Tax=Mycobacterium colombiense CECT 3035 TaxID=1041522 RepID=J5E5D7_9MYCO|nr:bifunctional DNA primase/polymerase [Mycobacterium colombiense CECT 3035]
MFYPRKINTVAAESEAGKTWLMLAVAFDELRAGNSVLYIDFEDDEGSVVGRLLALQASPNWVRERFCYLRPTEALGVNDNLNDLCKLVMAYRPTLAVVDGVTESMTLHGLDPLSNRDVAAFCRILPRRLAAAGCATVCLDHVVKSTEARGRYALGGVHKLNAVDGCALILESREPFGIGLTGRSAILIAKDRPGMLRKYGQRRKDGLDHFADLEVTSHDRSYNEFEIRPARDTDREFRPTHLMRRISEVLQERGAMSQRQIIATVGGRRQYAIDALALLQRDGHVSDKSPHRLLRPFTDSDDGKES